MANKRVKVHYRRLRRDNNQFPASTFEAAIKAALEAKLRDGSRVRQRVQNRVTGAPGHEDYQRLLNNFHVGENFAFGTVCLFAPGELQALLQLSDPEEITEDMLAQWDIEEKAPASGYEYLHGITYWFVTGDHFYQIQHISLQPKAMEEYFTWLLRDQSKVIGADNYVELLVKFDRSQIGDDLGDIQSIEVGGLVPETMPVPSAAEDRPPRIVEIETRESVAEKLRAGFAKARRILDDLLGEVEAQKIIDSMPEDAALDVTVNIGYRAKRRKLQKEFMRNLESGLRNLPDGEIRVRNRDGEIKGDDARLSNDMNVERMRENSGLLKLESALDALAEVHRRFVFDGKIQP